MQGSGSEKTLPLLKKISLRRSALCLQDISCCFPFWSQATAAAAAAAAVVVVVVVGFSLSECRSRTIFAGFTHARTHAFSFFGDSNQISSRRRWRGTQFFSLLPKNVLDRCLFAAASLAFLVVFFFFYLKLLLLLSPCCSCCCSKRHFFHHHLSCSCRVTPWTVRQTEKQRLILKYFL